MSERLVETIAEVARRLGGQAIADGREDGGRYDLEGGDGAHQMSGATVVSGRTGDRAVLVDFFDSATLLVRLLYTGRRTFRIVPCSLLGAILSFRRRVRSGVEAFDDRFRVEHESGTPPDDLLADEGLLATVTALAPFEEISFGNGIVRLVTLYDSESVSPDDVLGLVSSLSELAAAAEAGAESRA